MPAAVVDGKLKEQSRTPDAFLKLAQLRKLDLNIRADAPSPSKITLIARIKVGTVALEKIIEAQILTIGVIFYENGERPPTFDVGDNDRVFASYSYSF